MDRGMQVMGVVQCNRLGQAKSLCLITCKVLMTSSLMCALAKNQSPAESCLLLKCVSAEKVGKQPAWLFVSDKLS